VFFFVDCRGFFLRHTQTGQCVSSSEELLFNQSIATFFSVVMTDNCLNDKAQLYYPDTTQLLHIFEKKGWVLSPLASSNFSALVVLAPKGILSELLIKLQNNITIHRLKQTAAGSLFFYNRPDPVCAEPSSRYIVKKTYCNKTQQEFTFGK
jgi:hypothetical protein